jgi:Uma2 family endonuclease
MGTTAVQSQTPDKTVQVAKPAQPKPISWDAFQRRYLTREDEFKYEWLNGTVEKTIRGMDRTQLHLLWNLLDLFDAMKAKGLVNGRLIAEPDLFFISNHRRPDIAWLTREQTFKLADSKAYEVPAFVIEVISPNDKSSRVEDKVANYRAAGVQVLWHIFPKQQQVNVISGRNLSLTKSCFNDDICSAEPALPNFKIAAKDIFSKK